MKFYGAYPNGFLERARALLGITPTDALLHVCGGQARQYPAKPRGFGPNDQTLDADANLSPDYLVNVATSPVPLDRGRYWPAILIDPPYTLDDAAHYAPGRSDLPSPNKVLKSALAVVRVGGRVGMLHYVLPQPPREGVRFVACVGVICGFNNRMRVFSVFEREAA